MRAAAKRAGRLLAALPAVLLASACQQPRGTSEHPLELGRGVYASGTLLPGRGLWTDIQIDAETLLVVSVQPPLAGLTVEAWRREPDPLDATRTRRPGPPRRGAPHVGPPPIQLPAEHRDLWLDAGAYTLSIAAPVRSSTGVSIDLSFLPAPSVASLEPAAVVFYGDGEGLRARLRLNGAGLRPDFTVLLAGAAKPTLAVDEGRHLLFEVVPADAEHIDEGLVLATPWQTIPLELPLHIERLDEPRRMTILGLPFRALPAGVALLGPSIEGAALRALADPDAEPDEGEPRSHAQPPGRWIGEVEVGQDLWRRVWNEDPSSARGEDLPVHGVSFPQALEFCRRFARGAVEEDPRWEGWEFDLPTEEEWEYACRAGTRTPIAVPADPGDETAFERRLGTYAWFVDNARTHPLGNGPFPRATRRPNAWMLHDFHGNVFEWCHASPQLPAPPEGHAVLRGGSYATTYRGCRASNRDFEPVDTVNRRIGLRLVARPPR